MSNVDTRPTETPCHSADVRGPVVERYESRVVPLGGIRGIEVHRLLPQRVLPTVGAWCFLDKFGPQHDDMRVLPHPHIGLQTVTWPLAGRIRHRDSLGNDVEIEPGQLNLMTSGGGISHSELSLGDRPLLDGLQLWVALPAADATVEPAFERHVQLPRHEADGLRAYFGSPAEATADEGRATVDDSHAVALERERVGSERGHRPRIGAADVGARRHQQARGGDAALGEADHRHAAACERRQVRAASRCHVHLLRQRRHTLTRSIRGSPRTSAASAW